MLNFAVMKKFVLILSVLLAGAGSVFAQKSKNHNFEINRNLEIFSDIYRQLDMYYVDTLDADTVIGWAIQSMLRQVDPFTVYYSEDNMDELKTMTTGKYAGIGAVVRFIKKEDRVAIDEPYEGTPAYKAGVKAGDVILTIDGVDIKGMPVDKVTTMLKGTPGSSFVLEVRRYGVEKPLTFKIVRENIQLPSVPYYGMLPGNVGYIVLTGFTDNCSKDVRRALVSLKEQGARSLVLDLRGNGGGLLSEAVEIVNFFVPKGKKVVYTKGKVQSANVEYTTRKEPLDTVMPMAVLVDRWSASASEIVSGSLQDFDRALIVGTRTYGKGLVQTPREVPYNGSLKVTTSRYYIPSGRCIQAYDYRHLNEDGSVGTVPDSLTRVFHTAAGREVRDGGGITPDVTITSNDTLPSMVVELAVNDVVAEFGNWYVAQHDTIAPAASFDVADEDYAQFVKMVKESGFTYNKRGRELLKLLTKTAETEGYTEEARETLNQLDTIFKGNLEADMERNKKEIKLLLNDEIVRRYYYQKGGIELRIREDKDLKKACSLLADEKVYKEKLNIKD